MDLLTYEWRRARTIKTTWITSAFVVLSLAAVAFLTGSILKAAEVQEIVSPAAIIDQTLVANPIVIVLVSSLGAMAFGHEYRYGTIRLTLTAFPRRGPVFWAKLAMTLIISIAAVTVAVVAVYAGLLAILGNAGAPEGSQASALVWHALVFTATYALLAFAVTVITRSHPLGIVAPLLLFMVELVMVPVFGERLPWLPKVLPITAMGNWFSGQSVPLSVGVWAAWLVGLLALGVVLFQRRDA